MATTAWQQMRDVKARIEEERDAMRSLLEGVLHQLETDSDLQECVSAPDKYAYLAARCRTVLGRAPWAHDEEPTR